MSAAEVDKEVREAFKLWSDVTDLSFTKRGYGPVHIEIRFETRSGLALISNLEDLWLYFFLIIFRFAEYLIDETLSEHKSVFNRLNFSMILFFSYKWPEMCLLILK